MISRVVTSAGVLTGALASHLAASAAERSKRRRAMATRRVYGPGEERERAARGLIAALGVLHASARADLGMPGDLRTEDRSRVRPAGRNGNGPDCMGSRGRRPWWSG
ncbi:hypothetical protein ACIQF6_13790 [Kitasatospora sp. NPDC092948]|uniref:hypothetical protein n=1 Tax=Kitasatospora sp. NPDC092948 TaxID=3364088 RepID=UPI00381D602C